ncbi:hypothetical protein ABZ611_01350 [Streptomyces sp. NPDC007861]|uniref:hypothetical protein n=1 Tax=Streptomyces sp. NPDC007861 TaxID=3154893 RepID=UPI0033C612E2
MRGRLHDVVWGTVRVVLAIALFGVVWQLAQSAEHGRADDLGFPRLAIRDAEGRDTGRLKVCGDLYREPFCLRAEPVAVDDVLRKRKTSGGDRYLIEFGRSDGPPLALTLRVDRADEDVIKAAAGGRGEATLYWWRDSVRLLEVSAGGEERTIRTAHYPGREFTPPAAFGAAVAGLGAAALWAGLWRIVRGGACRLNWPWQTAAPGVTFTMAGLGGALGALFSASSPRAMVWTAGVVGAVSAVGMACWAHWWVRRRLPALDRIAPLAPVTERRFPGAVWGPGPWKALSAGWLRTGPQGLAAVPGPATGTGTFGVQPFPGALRLVQVRPPHRDDPLRLRFGYRRTDGSAEPGPKEEQFPLVAECEAVGGPVPGARVLIGAGTEDLPYVLGALCAAAPSAPSDDGGEDVRQRE